MKVGTLVIWLVMTDNIVPAIRSVRVHVYLLPPILASCPPTHEYGFSLIPWYSENTVMVGSMRLKATAAMGPETRVVAVIVAVAVQVRVDGGPITRGTTNNPTAWSL